jgi:cytochrome c-type biogenesis protein CcmH
MRAMTSHRHPEARGALAPRLEGRRPRSCPHHPSRLGAPFPLNAGRVTALRLASQDDGARGFHRDEAHWQLSCVVREGLSGAWSRAAALFAVLLLALTLGLPAHAVQPDEILPDSTLEARARALSKELRCMVCQNQSIDDSDAPLAKDLRVLVRERLTAGDSDSQVIDFLVSRYGEFVLLKPRIAPHTAILWGAPLAVLVIGAIVVFVTVRRRRGTEAVPAPAALSPEEQRRLERLIER